MMEDQLINRLQQIRRIPEEDEALILDAFEKRSFEEGEPLFLGGHVCRQLFFILSGVLRIVVRNDKGAEVTHYFLKENRFCTILKSFREGTVAEESIQAACPAEVRAVSKTRLLEVYQKLPYLSAMIDQIIQQGLIEKIDIRNAYLGMDSATRYRVFLARQPEIALKVSLSDIASYLGITPQSLSRIRRKK